jgi:hypothetical protein
MAIIAQLARENASQAEIRFTPRLPTSVRSHFPTAVFN